MEFVRTMYICKECHTVFEEPYIICDSHDMPWPYHEEFQCCPDCLSDDFEESARCKKCGGWVPESESMFGLCEECEAKTNEKFELIKKIAQLVFDKNERDYLNWKAEEL